MNIAWLNPKLKSEIRNELALARDKDPSIRQTANPAMKAIAEMNGDKKLYQALGSVAIPKLLVDFDSNLTAMLCPPPAGLGHHVGIVLGLDKKGVLACVASNCIKQPKPTAQPKKDKTTEPTSSDAAFFESFNRSSENARTALIQSVIDEACIDQMDWAELMCAEAERYHTMAGFIVVLAKNKPVVFITTLVLRGPVNKQENKIFTGRISHVG